MDGNRGLILLVIILCAANLYFASTNSVKIKQLEEDNLLLVSMVDSLKNVKPVIAQQPVTPKQTSSKSKVEPVAKPATSQAVSAPTVSTPAVSTSTSTTKKQGKIKVSSSYRLDDRYISYRVEPPEYIGNEEGIVKVDIVVDKLGRVKKTEINASSTITDEEVVLSARRAALKTDFNYASDAPDAQKGSITFTYAR